MEEIKNKWAIQNDFMSWEDFMKKHYHLNGTTNIPESIVNELLELAINEL